MLFTSITPVFAATENKADNNPKANLSVSVTADKKQYSIDEQIIFNISVTNNGDFDVENVALYNELDLDLEFTQGKSPIMINKISAGETVTKTIKAGRHSFIKLDNEKIDAVFDMIVQILDMIKRIFGIFCSLFYSNVNYCNVIMGEETVSVLSIAIARSSSNGTEEEKNSLAINKSIFEYDENNKEYSLSVPADNIEGTLNNPENVKSLSFTVYDDFDNIIDTGRISAADTWKTKDVNFIMGNNKLVVTADFKNGETLQDEVEIKCYTDAYMNNVQIDTTTDTDNDGVVDYLELNYTNTDINSADTDGDGLSDYYETVVLSYDPLNVDTDADGISDADEDYDGDKITNIDEIRLGLDPAFNDSDIDDLTDYDEINVYNTDPAKKDTDEDGVSDGEEVRLGTNPLKKEEKFKETASEGGNVTENNPVSVEAKVTVDSSQVGTLEINPVTYSDNPLISPSVPGYLGVAYDFSIDGDFEEAELIFNYDTSLGTIGPDFQPRIYYLNETTGMFEEMPDQTVTNGKVTVKTTHFSTYILLNKVKFDEVWETEIKPPVLDGSGQSASRIDVVFVIDTSGSMSGSRLNTAKRAMNEFLDALTDEDQAALVSFNSTATIKCDLSKDKDAVSSAVNNLYADGLTSVYAGLDKAIQVLTDESKSYGYKMIIVLSDGYDEPSTNYNSKYAPLVEQANNNDIVVYSIGTGSSDTTTLTRIANETGGKYYAATQASDIIDVFFEIQEDTVDLTTDTNNDKIPDYFNDLLFKGDLVLSNGSNEFAGINFNFDENQDGETLCADFDGDGLLNGEELVVTVNSDNTVYITMISDPMMDDSDGDGEDDYSEVKIYKSNPLKPSYFTSFIDGLRDDSNYMYYDIFKGESDWLNTIARNTWSTVTFNWSHKDEAQAIVTDFLKEQAKVENIESLANAAEKDMANNLIAQANDELSDKITDTIEGINNTWDAIEAVNDLVHLKINLKKWNSSARSAKNITSNMWSEFKAHIGLYKRWNKSWKWVSSVGKVMDWMPAVEEAGLIFDVANTYSALAATSENFVIFEDILTNIKNNDTLDEKYVAKGIEPILKIIKDNDASLFADACSDVLTGTLENLGKVGLMLLSKTNPFLIAIDAVVLAGELLGVSQITEGAYALYVVNALVDSCNSLVHYDYSETMSSFDDTQKLYFRFMYSARLKGGEYGIQITSKQFFIGEKDSVARERIKNEIESDNSFAKTCYNQLGL